MADISQEHLTDADKLCVSDDGKYVVHGEGVFDDLMEAVNVHLDSQYKLGRLPGEKYADVYLGSLQSTLGAAVQFLLGEQQADKQAELTQKQTDLVVEQITTEKLKHEQIKAQTDQIRAQTEQVKAQTIQIQEQTKLITAKICTEKAIACGPGPVAGTTRYAEMKLLEKQEESFDRNNENKFLQVVLNAQAANSNVAGEPLCAVGAYQASGADHLIREVGNNHDINVPGPSDDCSWTEAFLEKKQLEAQKLLHEIQKERTKLGIPDPDPPASHRDDIK